MIQIAQAEAAYEREPLSTPFGFKGQTITEIWQSVAGLRDAHGHVGVGVGVQSVLWSDAAVFAARGEASGNELMFQLSTQLLRLAVGRSFQRPEQLFDQLLPDALEQGRRLTQRPDLRTTFVLNAMVAVDNAAWQLFARNAQEADFDALISPYREAVGQRHDRLAAIPIISYNTPLAAIRALVEGGSFILKIKIGSDPARDDDRAKMLAWDCARLSEIHATVQGIHTDHTANGHVAYYLDANGRYDSVGRVHRLLDHCAAIGALDRIILLEEPFPEEFSVDVRGFPVRVAADESAHSVADVEARIEAGYGAIALKPAAKTLSLSLRMAAAAQARGVPCFCADLTASPLLLDWAKNVAARLAPLPGIAMGAIEANGSQNYARWEQLQAFHPCPQGSWLNARQGLFQLDESFYRNAGGILLDSPHYSSLVPAICPAREAVPSTQSHP
ncbi:MAG TPA: enolase C-terminal domain-like protein [Lacunisphaera sp.]|nr:enolase C-terminal domain-like protein [Lacunisphaera sp.]